MKATCTRELTATKTKRKKDLKTTFRGATMKFSQERCRVIEVHLRELPRSGGVTIAPLARAVLSSLNILGIATRLCETHLECISIYVGSDRYFNLKIIWFPLNCKRNPIQQKLKHIISLSSPSFYFYYLIRPITYALVWALVFKMA